MSTFLKLSSSRNTPYGEMVKVIGGNMHKYEQISVALSVHKKRENTRRSSRKDRPRSCVKT